MKILSICIPTFQRSILLVKCIESIVSDIENSKLKKNYIEVLIFDNNSSDNTEEIIQFYIQKYKYVKYFKNNLNVGSDKNIAKCYDFPKSEFVWVLGDDDQIVPGTIKYIFTIFEKEKSDYGLIFLNPYSYDQKEIQVPKKSKSYKIFSKSDFLSKYHVKLTFLSSLLLRNNKKFKASKFIGTSLVQFHYSLKVLDIHEKCIVADGFNILAKRENSGEDDLSYKIKRNKVNVSDVFINGFLKKINDNINDKRKFEKVKMNFLLSYVIYEYVYISNSHIPDKDFDALDKHYQNSWIYSQVIRSLLKKSTTTFNKYILLSICLINRIKEGELLKILNFIISDFKSFKFKQKKEIPFIFVDGQRYGDFTYENGVVWKDGSTSAGNGYESGGMYWRESDGSVVIPVKGLYLINWHPMHTNSDNHRGEQRWLITKNHNYDFPIATSHWNGSGGSSLSFSTTTTIFLNENDTIQVYADKVFVPRLFAWRACTYLNIIFIS